MRKFMKKIIGFFIIICSYFVGCANKIYALTPLYGPYKPEEPSFVEKIFELINKILINQVTALIVVITGIIVYLVKSKDGKKTKILMVLMIILILCIIIVPLYLLARASYNSML